MKILITGSEGFIGSHLTELLVKSGYKVKCFILYNSFNSKGWLNNISKKLQKNCEFYFGDIRDTVSVKNAVRNTDVIIHLAALIGIPYSYSSPESYVDTNIKGTLNLLNSALSSNVKKFIHASTSEVYGSAKYIPMDEKHPINCQSPYSASKAAADNLVISYYKSFGLPTTILRPFNTFGPRQSLRAVIPTIISQAMFNNNIIKLGNIKAKRDFTYVSDTINAFKLAIKNKKIIGETLNLGNNLEIKIEEIIKIVEEKLNIKLKVIVDKKRIRPKNSEVNRLLSNNKKAKKLLNWEIKYKGINGFKKGIEKTLGWIDNNQEIFLKESNKYTI